MKKDHLKNILSGFTVIELMVSISIIGLLVIAIYIGTAGASTRAKCARVKEDFELIAKAAKFDWLTTKDWAVDVGTGVAPSFVGSGQLAQWPKASFYQKDISFGTAVYDAMYDWEVWPTPGNPEAGAIKAISLRAPKPTRRVSDPNNHNNPNPAPFDEEFYFCVQDDRVSADKCYWTTQNPPTALNVGGNCPVQ